MGPRQAVVDGIKSSGLYRRLLVAVRFLAGADQRNILSSSAEVAMKPWLHALDAMDEPSGEEVDALRMGTKGYAGYVARCIKAKDGFGTPKYTEANVLVVRRKVADQMREHGVRPSHIVRLMPIATALVFTPTQGEVEAQQFLATAAAAERRKIAGLWSRRTWWGLEAGPAPMPA